MKKKGNRINLIKKRDNSEKKLEIIVKNRKKGKLKKIRRLKRN
jgi:hypothetical protein